MNRDVRSTGKVLGAQIDALSWEDAMARLLGWTHAHDSRYVTICNVHVVVSASRDAGCCDIINGSDMATPDGARWRGCCGGRGLPGAQRWAGSDVGAVLSVWRCQENESKMRVRGAVLAAGWTAFCRALNLKRWGCNDVCGDFAMRDT
jgi:UDP-N-acetyl-D-mannosaminuronic acid transferase (WecB/TagA/CpsF family)